MVKGRKPIVQTDQRRYDSVPSMSAPITNRVYRPQKRDANCNFQQSYRFGSAGKVKGIEDIVKMISMRKVQNVVVIVGAGISTPSGIPDFRTPGTGLYDNLKRYNIPYPQAIFDMDYFACNPRPFFTLAKELYPSGKYQPNYVHYFLKLLHSKNILLRVYTQNIDGLERMAGIPKEKVVEAHGTFLTSSCIKCKQTQSAERVKTAIFNNKMPYCIRPFCRGLVKPDVVFFGEDLPNRFYAYLRDLPKADMVLVMGTSLQVEPFSNIVNSCRTYIPRILFNRVAVEPFSRNLRQNDIVIEGDVVTILKRLVHLLGWSDGMEDLLSKNIVHQEKKTEDLPHLDRKKKKVPTATLR